MAIYFRPTFYLSSPILFILVLKLDDGSTNDDERDVTATATAAAAAKNFDLAEI